MALKDLIVKIRGDKSDLDQKLEGAGGSLGKFKLKALALAGAITGAVAGAFSIFKKALESTKAGSDLLERSIATAKGALGGFFTTIGTGNFKLSDIIENMKKGARAAREYAFSVQLMEEQIASSNLNKAYLEWAKSEAMVRAYETKNAAERKKFVEEAINLQKQITENEREQIDMQLEVFERAYARAMPEAAQEYSTAMRDVFIALTRNRKALDEFSDAFKQRKEQFVFGSKEEKAEAYKFFKEIADQLGIKDVEAVRRLAEAYLYLENVMYKRETPLSKYVELLTKSVNVEAEGEAALKLMTRMLTNLTEETKESNIELEKLKGQFADLAKIKIEPKALDLGLRPMTQQIVATGEEWKNIMNSLNDFVDSFAFDIVESIGMALGGANIEDLGKSLLLSFANFLSQLGQMLIYYSGILQAFQLTSQNPAAWPVALAAGVAALIAAGAIKAAVRGGMSTVAHGGGGGGVSNYNAQAGSLRVVIEGKLRGKDIYLANRRYEEVKG